MVKPRLSPWLPFVVMKSFTCDKPGEFGTKRTPQSIATVASYCTHCQGIRHWDKIQSDLYQFSETEQLRSIKYKIMVNFPAICCHIHTEAFRIKMLLTATDDRIHMMVSKVVIAC